MNLLKFIELDRTFYNMTDEKVYTPETIPDNPLPEQIGDLESKAAGGATGTDLHKPSTIPDNPLPRKIIAHETIGSALNTKARKILGAFEFVQQGAIQIGKFILGESGDIKISPNGIVARNLAGNPTFTLDGETGDAVFAGEIQSGALITGNVIIGDGGVLQIGSGASDTLIDELGIVSANNFGIYSTSGSPLTTFTNTSYANVSGTNSLTFTLLRPVRAFAFLSVNSSSEQVVNTDPCSGRTFYKMNDTVSGSLITLFYDAELKYGADEDRLKENIISKPYVVSGGVTLSAGNHIITLQSALGSVVNFRSILNDYSMSILLLGS